MDGVIIGTVVGSVLGFLAALLPDIFSLIRDRYGKTTPPLTRPTNDFNGQVVDGDAPTTIAAPQNGVVLASEPDDVPADEPTHFLVLDFLRASVRPVITYAFFGLFAIIKLVALVYAYSVEHVKTVELLPILWDEGTEALFAAVLSFWFGSRAMMRIRKR